MISPSRSLPARLLRFACGDPRHYQIVSLAGLLTFGILRFQFDVRPHQAVLIVAAAVLTQWVGDTLSRRHAGGEELRPASAFDPRSALISALSLCLLLRTNSPAIAALAGSLAIGSKFLLRWRGKHIFNPTNFALVLLLIMSDSRAWVSSGQWGSGVTFAFLMASLGGLVVTRARRADITVAFLLFHAAFLFGRSWSLGEPMTIPVHRMESGALILFAFFMISDPRSTPDSRLGRVLFAFLTAFGAWYVTFRLFRPNGLLWSLAAVSCLTPLLDLLLPGKRYRWNEVSPTPQAESEQSAAMLPVEQHPTGAGSI